MKYATDDYDMFKWSPYQAIEKVKTTPRSTVPRLVSRKVCEMKTDSELQIELTKLLPEKLYFLKKEVYISYRIKGGPTMPVVLICWKGKRSAIQESEWLHVCQLIEHSLSAKELADYEHLLTVQYGFIKALTAIWQQRALAILKVKGLYDKRTNH